MKVLDQLSGPWTGFSIQDGVRIMERLHLRIGNGMFRGYGHDMDGDFVVDGGYEGNVIHTVRRYTQVKDRATGAYRFDPEAVRSLYDYVGTWDGSLIGGSWCSQTYPMEMNGPFEWWPDSEEDRKELQIEIAELTLALPERTR